MNIEQGKMILIRHIAQDKQQKALELLDKPDSSKRIINPLIPYDICSKFNNYYSTSNAICYGDALEEILNTFLQEKEGYILSRDTVPDKDCDCLFQYDNKTILIEMKVRDDHDSTKKVSQVNNFNIKMEYLIRNYSNVIGVMWFVDPSFSKNSNYYKGIIGIEKVLYGVDIEEFLRNIFGDNRCDGLFDFIVQITMAYNQTNHTTYTESLNIDYHKLSSMQLRNLISNRFLYKDAIKFFLGNVELQELLEYVHTLPKYQTAKEVSIILEEYINEL